MIHRLFLAALVVLLPALFLVPLISHAGDDKKKSKHLRYVATYEAALLEARIRNLPVFVSRHKDY